MFKDNLNRWSIRQANSRLHAQGIQTLENDLLQKANQEIQPAIESYLTGLPMVRGTLETKAYGFNYPSLAVEQDTKAHELPTLKQLMRLHTYSPFTQSHFTTFLKRRGAQQNLQFLMELDTHDKLWRSYLQGVDRHNRQRLSQFLESAGEKQDTKVEPAYASRTLDRTLTRHDLADNARRIYQTYCLSSQPVHLPRDHSRALEDLVLQQGCAEPIVFDSAKEHVFEVLEAFYYPPFVDRVLYKNISSATARLCLLLSILLLTLGFSIEFSLIFLDSSYSRWLALAPFFLGWSLLVTSLCRFAWWFGITSVSEIEYMVLYEVQDMAVKDLHCKQGWLWLAFITLLSILNTILFAFIPSHRL